METVNARAAVARNVRAVRERRGRSQAELARQMGWARSTLNKLEGGERNITVDELLSLGMALNIAPAALLVPWNDDELAVLNWGGNIEVRITGEQGYGWVVGMPDPQTMFFMGGNPADYFSTMPPVAMRRYGSVWFEKVGQDLGWEFTETGIKSPGGISVSWGEED